MHGITEQLLRSVGLKVRISQRATRVELVKAGRSTMNTLLDPPGKLETGITSVVMV